MSNREYESRETSQTRNEESSSSFLLGAIIGGVVGAAAALLFASKTGKDLRNTITNNASSLVNKTGHFGETMKSKTSSFSQGIAQQSVELINKVKGKTSCQDDAGKETETTYISIGTPAKNSSVTPENKGLASDDEIRKKLMEAQMAFDEEESRIKL